MSSQIDTPSTAAAEQTGQADQTEHTDQTEQIEQTEQAEQERWPDVYAVPKTPLRALVAERVVRRMVRDVPVRITLPGGRVFGGGGPDAPTLAVHRPEAFFRRVGARGLIGFGESYQAADWDCADLPGLIAAFGVRADSLVPPVFQRLRGLYTAHRPHADRNTADGARRNISRHYDLSDDLFALFLDATMTYSSALFDQDGLTASATEQLLAPAQRRKIDRLLDLAAVGPGTRLLEIGSGWGELAVRAAARGAQVRTITLSENQHAYTRRRAAEARLGDRVEAELRDYRDVEGEYDAIISVEMIEAVGREYWPDYFAALARLLAPGGRIGLQAITMPHHRMVATAGTHTWMTEYIFPGGLIPSVTAIEQNAAAAGLRIADDLAFGAHYAQTLRLWRERFGGNARRLGELGFDETFRRTWNLYLAYCEAGFACGYLDVHQFLITRT
jgi:cyclopropane-fatty-acyl-phospholipid synthase